MKENIQKTAQCACDLNTPFQPRKPEYTPHDEVVRYYDFAEKFRPETMALRDWKELKTHELIKLLEDFHKELFKRLGS